MKLKTNKQGFSMVGVLAAIAIAASLATVVFLEISPSKRLADSNDVKRKKDVQDIITAIEMYTLDNHQLPPELANLELSANEKMVFCSEAGTASCGEEIVNCLLVNDENFVGKYLGNLPIDPKKSSPTDTGYYISKTPTGAIKVGSCQTSNPGQEITYLASAALAPDPYCGDGSCNGAETCSTCPGDCGVCAPTCGDGSCNGDETCSTCPGDCGACPLSPYEVTMYAGAGTDISCGEALLKWTGANNITANNDLPAELVVASSNNIRDHLVKLIKADNTYSLEDKYSDVLWPSYWSIVSYGDSNALWGESWTAADINNSNFGAVIQVTDNSSISNCLEAKNFGFSIPSGAIITGIKANIDKVGDPSLGYNSDKDEVKMALKLPPAPSPDGGPMAKIDFISLTVYYEN